MKMTRSKKALSFILCIVLIAAMALLTIGCKADTQTNSGSSLPETSVSETEATTLGSGATKFNITVTDVEGKQTDFIINTDKKTVADALLELKVKKLPS